MSGDRVDRSTDDTALADAEVVTTVVEMDDVEIKVSVSGDISIITVTGPYSARIGREIDKVARKCSGSLGIEFRTTPSKTKPVRPLHFDPSVLRLLKNLQLSCERRGDTFFLYTPPPKLEDLLKLSGVWENYRIVDREGGLSNLERRRPEPRRDPRGNRSFRTQPPSSGDANTAGKKIYKLSTSLERTASLEKGLDSAEKCVMRFLPERPPEAEGYDFAFSYKSSEKIGGDFFDFVALDEHRLGISIGDVSGHGIDAALIMGMSKKLISIRALDARDAPPSEVLKKVNVDVSPDLNRSTFVTALYGVLDLRTGEFVFARAGHEPPIAFGDGTTNSVHSNGVALGLGIQKYFDSQIEDARVTIAPGQCLLLTTDGIGECRGPREAIYSRERLTFECSQTDARGTPAREVLDRLLGKVEAFAAGRAQEDDMTAILIRRDEGDASENTSPGSAESPPAELSDGSN